MEDRLVFYNDSIDTLNELTNIIKDVLGELKDLVNSEEKVNDEIFLEYLRDVEATAFTISNMCVIGIGDSIGGWD